MSARHREFYIRKAGPGMTGWHDAPAAAMPDRPAGLAARCCGAAGCWAALTYGGLVILLLVRLVEWPLFGQARPVTPYITQFVCRAALRHPAAAADRSTAAR